MSLESEIIIDTPNQFFPFSFVKMKRKKNEMKAKNQDIISRRNENT